MDSLRIKDGSFSKSEVFMKVNSKIIRNMGKECLPGPMEAPTPVISSQEI